MGLFHLLMAAAKALHRTYLQPKIGRNDVHSTFVHVGIVQPLESGTFISLKGPRFHAMDKFLEYELASNILDCWHVVLAEDYPLFITFQDYVATNLHWDEIVCFQNELPRNLLLEHLFQSYPKRIYLNMTRYFKMHYSGTGIFYYIVNCDMP